MPDNHVHIQNQTGKLLCVLVGEGRLDTGKTSDKLEEVTCIACVVLFTSEAALAVQEAREIYDAAKQRFTTLRKHVLENAEDLTECARTGVPGAGVARRS